MEIRKQILGIIIGIFITISFITPVYSYYLNTNICDLNVGELELVVMESIASCRVIDEEIYC
ncbi:hypothetical protein N8477_05060 [Candidatus Thioglobus sp.]|jgi:hypothetical protein|nr:hypothetical protein [Candidatus Thioglobus sp.]